MYGSAITLSAALQNTGAAHALVNLLIQAGFNSPQLVMSLMDIHLVVGVLVPVIIGYPALIVLNMQMIQH